MIANPRDSVLLPFTERLLRAGDWFLRSGIQEPNGGVARYHRADLNRNLAVSTEITGYAATALVYLHSVTGDERYLERAVAAARYLSRVAWNAASRVMPFELDPPALTYFFDCGIIVRGLLAAWRVVGDDEFLNTAAALGRAMIADFTAEDASLHPILRLPGKEPVERQPLVWSRFTGCYQLKAAMAWWDLAEATGDESFRRPYLRALEDSLRTYTAFLPGHPERLRVMDRLHPFLYFLEGLLPCAREERCAAALRDGIHRAQHWLREIAPEFERSDAYAQLLRIRVLADGAGAAPLDGAAAEYEAKRLAEFQTPAGGYYFGRKGDSWVPHLNPVSTAFAMQAIEIWRAKDGKPLGCLLI